MTLSQAHAKCIRGDRILRIMNQISGRWYQDHVLDYVNANQFRICELVLENDQIVTVRLKEDE